MLHTPPLQSLTERDARAPWAVDGLVRLDYVSALDGRSDWAMVLPGERHACWAVFLHGHGSTGDQLFTRLDIRSLWLPASRRLGLGILAPNLRGDAWMCPSAVADLAALLDWVRSRYGARRFFFSSGSMGGTGNLVYAGLRPHDCAAVVARCPATELADYHAWLGADAEGVRLEIREAIEAGYGGPPDTSPQTYAAHSVIANAVRLTMPLFIVHGDADALIPVEQSRRLVDAMDGAPNLAYIEMPGGGHDAPLGHPAAWEWFAEQVDTCGRQPNCVCTLQRTTRKGFP